MIASIFFISRSQLQNSNSLVHAVNSIPTKSQIIFF